jgi:hypothetical protein
MGLYIIVGRNDGGTHRVIKNKEKFLFFILKIKKRDCGKNAIDVYLLLR